MHTNDITAELLPTDWEKSVFLIQMQDTAVMMWKKKLFSLIIFLLSRLNTAICI